MDISGAAQRGEKDVHRHKMTAVPVAGRRNRSVFCTCRTVPRSKRHGFGGFVLEIAQTFVRGRALHRIRLHCESTCEYPAGSGTGRGSRRRTRNAHSLSAAEIVGASSETGLRECGPLLHPGGLQIRDPGIKQSREITCAECLLARHVCARLAPATSAPWALPRR